MLSVLVKVVFAYGLFGAFLAVVFVLAEWCGEWLERGVSEAFGVEDLEDAWRLPARTPPHERGPVS